MYGRNRGVCQARIPRSELELRGVRNLIADGCDNAYTESSSAFTGKSLPSDPGVARGDCGYLFLYLPQIKARRPLIDQHRGGKGVHAEKVALGLV